MRGRGCGACGGTGSRGRIGIFEVLPITASVRSVLLHTPTEAAVGAAARAAGMTTLRAAGLARARRGETTFEEVLRVSHVDATAGRRCTSCDRAVDDDMVACPWCATVVDRGHCTSCARPLDVDWKICPWCRTSAANQEVAGSTALRLPRVLVVAADPALPELIGGAITGDVDIAVNADEALSAVWDKQYDGVVVHDALPDLSGLELLRMLRNASHTAALPLMFVTTTEAADGFESDPSQAHLAGVDDVLPIATPVHEVTARLAELIARSPHLASLRSAAVAAASPAAPAAPAKRTRTPRTPTLRRPRA
jgi:CheY-like chemotaxis protein